MVATNAIGDSAASTASAAFVAATTPDAPTITGVTRGDNSAIVAITANGDGADPITGYTVTCTSSDGGTTQSNSGATSPVTVGSLTNTNTYTCTAVATNGFGDSPDSAASSSFVAATAPDAPTLTTTDLRLQLGRRRPSPRTATAATRSPATPRPAPRATAARRGRRPARPRRSPWARSPTATPTPAWSSPRTRSATARHRRASSPFVAMGVADAPTITSVDLDLDAVAVDFTANADGGDAVTGFTATCTSSDGGTTQSNTGTSSPVTVSSLDNGKTYTCVVVATNCVRRQRRVRPRRARSSPAAPRPRPTVTGVTRGSNSADVAFTSNGDGGDAIIDYRVTCTFERTAASAGSRRAELADHRRARCRTAAPTRARSLRPTRSRTASRRRRRALRRRQPSRVAPTVTDVTRGRNSAIVTFTANGDGGEHDHRLHGHVCVERRRHDADGVRRARRRSRSGR